jgi:hypothetical protein
MQRSDRFPTPATAADADQLTASARSPRSSVEDAWDQARCRLHKLAVTIQRPHGRAEAVASASKSVFQVLTW